MVTCRETFAGLDVVSYRNDEAREDRRASRLDQRQHQAVRRGWAGRLRRDPAPQGRSNSRAPPRGPGRRPDRGPTALQGELADVIVANIEAKQAPQALRVASPFTWKSGPGSLSRALRLDGRAFSEPGDGSARAVLARYSAMRSRTLPR